MATKKVIHCKYHPEAILLEARESGDAVCSRCGLVVGERIIDFDSEWRSFANDTDGYDGCRVGKVEHSEQDQTNVSTTVKQSYDPRHLDENGKSKYQLMPQIPYSEVTKIKIKKLLIVLCDVINASQSFSTSMNIYQQMSESKLTCKKNKYIIAGVCLYLACIDDGAPRTTKEILDNLINVKEKPFRHFLKHVQTGLKRKSIEAKPEQYVRRFVFKLGTGKNIKIEKLSLEIIKIIESTALLRCKMAPVIALSAIDTACKLFNMSTNFSLFIDCVRDSKASVKSITILLMEKPVEN